MNESSILTGRRFIESSLISAEYAVICPQRRNLRFSRFQIWLHIQCAVIFRADTNYVYETLPRPPLSAGRDGGTVHDSRFCAEDAPSSDQEKLEIVFVNFGTCLTAEFDTPCRVVLSPVNLRPRIEFAPAVDYCDLIFCPFDLFVSDVKITIFSDIGCFFPSASERSDGRFDLDSYLVPAPKKYNGLTLKVES